VQTRHPLLNLKTRAQAAFRFLYLDFDLAADDNETNARDCETVCVCNQKAPHGTAQVYADCRTVGNWAPPALDVWGPCNCQACRVQS